MPTIRVRNQIAAATPQQLFPLQGSQYEYIPWPARVEFSTIGVSSTPADVDLADATIYSGSDILQQRGPLTNKSGVTGATQSAVYPDDFLLDDVAAQGERLSVEVNTGSWAGTGFIDTVVRITPL